MTNSRDSQSQLLGRLDTLYINLDAREDRRADLERTLEPFDFLAIHRLSATKSQKPLVGHSESHLRAMVSIISSGRPALVLEDDARFKVEPAEVRRFIEAFLSDNRLDVLCLGYATGFTPIYLSHNFLVSFDLHTTVAYVAKPGAAGHLASSFSHASKMLAKGKPDHIAAGDVVWKRDQRRRLIFAIPTKRLVIQAPGWSDVQKAFVDYGV